MTEATKLVSVLLTAGADPAIDQNGLTPLHIAVMEDDVELAKVTCTHYFLLLLVFMKIIVFYYFSHYLKGRTHLKDIKTDNGSPLQLALKNGAINCWDLLFDLAYEKDIKLHVVIGVNLSMYILCLLKTIM